MSDWEWSEKSAQAALSAESRQILGLYPAHFAPTHVSGLQPIENTGGFSGARIWKIAAPAGNYCLRAWPEGSHAPERLRGLHRLLGHLTRRGVTESPVPVASRSGATLLSDNRRFWQLEPWMPGTADFTEHPSATRRRHAMLCLARWHQAAATFSPMGQEHTWFRSVGEAVSPGIGERIGLLQHWTPSRLHQAGEGLARLDWDEFRKLGLRILELFPEVRSHVERRLLMAADLRVSLQPCLRDVWHDHLLFTGDQVTGLIDAGSCRTENVTADLARLLGSLFADDRSAWHAALEDYQESHPLSLPEFNLLGAFDCSGVLLSGMTWIDWLVLRPRQVADREPIVSRVRRIVTRLEQLAQGV